MDLGGPRIFRPPALHRPDGAGGGAGAGEYILPLSLTNPQRAARVCSGCSASTPGKQPVNEEQPHLRRRLQRKNISVDPRSQLAGQVGAAPV